MNLSRAILILAASAAIGLPAVFLGKETAAPPDPPRIHSGDVPVGDLGLPIGTYLTIEGVRADGPKFANRTLKVDKINGQEVKEPLNTAIENVDLPANTRCVLKGYETGSMVGVPPAVFEAAEEQGKQLSPPQAGWQFRLHFVALSAVAPKNLEIKKTKRGE